MVDGIELHCGDVIEIRPRGKFRWRAVRVEWDHGQQARYWIDEPAGLTGDIEIGTPARWPVH